MRLRFGYFLLFLVSIWESGTLPTTHGRGAPVAVQGTGFQRLQPMGRFWVPAAAAGPVVSRGTRRASTSLHFHILPATDEFQKNDPKAVHIHLGSDPDVLEPLRGNISAVDDLCAAFLM
uniref:IPT/TIG domain-containing protein n=1 Tax=Oryza rufipogon TaxID=4529 RepID=A0A0E0P5U5_ORYRU